MMTDLFAARSQMALSLAFHMIFATIGMGMPLLMVLAEGLHLRTGREVYKALARSWAKGTAVLFAVGAVSGTVLSFELGLLWPRFMELAGPIIGMPFSLEGFAFFFEAILLGVYLYGWDRIRPWAHWWTGVGVWISGMASGIFVVTANAWMNTPTGFTLDAEGRVVSIDPLAAMLNPSAFGQAAHMAVAAVLATAFLVAGIHAWELRRQPGNPFHHEGLALGFWLGVATLGLQGLTGHVIAEAVAHNQPVKLAALEAQWETVSGAPFTLGGWPDEEAEVTRYGVEVPYLLSLLAFGDPHAEVMGLKDVPVDERPPVVVTHLAYQVMLGTFGGMAAVALAGIYLRLRGRSLPEVGWFRAALVAAAPLGLLGIEAGWTATEVGRQPWVVVGVLRTRDAVTPVTGLQTSLLAFTLLYLFLGVVTVALLRRQFHHSPRLEADHVA